MSLSRVRSGNEIGPFKAIEESTLATLIEKDKRSTIFAWYAVFSGLAGSIGSLSAGFITGQLITSHGWSVVSAYRVIFVQYALLGLVKGALTLLLSERCEASWKQKPPPPAAEEAQEEVPMLEQGEPRDEEAQTPKEPVPPNREPPRSLGLTKETRAKVRTLGCLFGLDNLASGLVPL